MKMEFPADKDRLNRDDLIDLVASRLKLKRDKAEELVVGTLDVIVATVQSGRSLLITGFGTFSPEDRASRNARNPQTGETIKAPARKDVKFAPGTLFRQYLNGRPLPKTGPLVGKAAKGSGKATADYVKAGVIKRRYVKKEKI